LRGKKTVIESLAVSTIWHVAKVYPPSREVIDTIQSAIWKFVWSKKPELVRRETCTSGYAAGGLGIVDVGLRSKALLIGRLFRLLDAEQPDCAWKELMRYYVNRMLGFNDNTRPNCDIPTPFYSHFLRVLREFNVDISCRRSSHAFYGEKIRNCVTPVRARCEDIWNRQLGPGLRWNEIWKEVAGSWNDPLLRDFDWRTVHRVLPVNVRMSQWNSRISAACACCGARVETLEHTLVHCPRIAKLWSFILTLCNRIDPTVVGFGEKSILLGCFPQRRTKDLLRYLVSVGKFAAWKQRVSYQFKKDEKIDCELYFTNYVRTRLKMEQYILSIEQFEVKWCVRSVLARVVNNKIHLLI
jgi:hypothetical protein